MDFPNFGWPGYPYANLMQQALASMQAPQGLASYGRFGGAGGVPPMLPGGNGGVTGAPGAPASPPFLTSMPGGLNPNPVSPAPPFPIGPGTGPTGAPPFMLPFPSGGGGAAPGGPTTLPFPSGAPGGGGLSSSPKSAVSTSGGSFSPNITQNPVSGGLLNVSPNASGIQATSGLNANDSMRFAFTPQAEKGLGNFSISPYLDQVAGQRSVTITDANGNPIGPTRNGIEPNLYFSTGGYVDPFTGKPDPRIPQLTTGQTYYVNVTGDPNQSGPANLDYGVNYGGGAPDMAHGLASSFVAQDPRMAQVLLQHGLTVPGVSSALLRQTLQGTRK